MHISTTNKDNEYLLYITKEGTVPKTLSINTYITPEESYFAEYYLNLKIIMIETTVRDIVERHASGKIKWDSQEHKFTLDQEYAKIIRKEEEKLQADPDKYLKELAEKKKKEEEEKLRKKEEEEKRKAEEAKKLAQQKMQEEANRIIQQNFEAMKEELRRKRLADSLSAIEAAKAKQVLQKPEESVSSEEVDRSVFNGADSYSLNIAKKSLKVAQEKMNRKKAANLSTKYETNNILTSLFDMADEYDKKIKKR
jgi:hypothetical protein